MNENLEKVQSTGHDYTQEEYRKIGVALSMLDAKKMKLEVENDKAKEIIQKLEDNPISDEICLAFELAMGIDISTMKAATENALEKNTSEIERIIALKEKIVFDPNRLLPVAEFLDLIYQPNQG